MELDGVGNCSQFGSIFALDSCIPRVFTVFEGAITITLVADNQKCHTPKETSQLERIHLLPFRMII